MSNLYSCIDCNYETDRLSNYKRHLKSSKHLKMINLKSDDSYLKVRASTRRPEIPKLKCIYCDKLISKTNISKHISICKVKIQIITFVFKKCIDFVKK
jgi:hypothetical protein